MSPEVRVAPVPVVGARGEERSSKGVQRQLVNYAFYKVDPAWRRLSDEARERGRREFLEVVESFRERMLILPYSTLGIRSDADFMLWRISDELEPLQEMTAALLRTGLGQYLEPAHSFLAVTKRSIYVDKHVHQGQSESRRAQIVPGKSKYLFVYPFVKIREWYLLPKERRQEMMDTHIAVGHRYPSVKINTSYSFGLDDQEFVVAFESDSLHDFLDLVMDLRETEGSKYTLRDTPTFTCVSTPLPDLLRSLG